MIHDRPTSTAYDPIPVRRAAILLHAAFRRRLATTPLRFANPSPPSRWISDLHPQVEKHAWQTKKTRETARGFFVGVIHQLLNFVALHVGIRLSKLSQFFPVIDAVFHSEGACLATRFDIRDALDFR